MMMGIHQPRNDDGVRSEIPNFVPFIANRSMGWLYALNASIAYEKCRILMDDRRSIRLEPLEYRLCLEALGRGHRIYLLLVDGTVNTAGHGRGVPARVTDDIDQGI